MAKGKKNGVEAGMLSKRFDMPSRCNCKEIVVRELNGHDEIEAAIWIDKHASSAASSISAQIQADARENMRLALVEVDGVPVNVNGVPFMELDGWSARTLRFVQQAYNDLNGVDPDELKKFRAGGQVVRGPRKNGEATDTSTVE